MGFLKSGILMAGSRLRAHRAVAGGFAFWAGSVVLAYADVALPPHPIGDPRTWVSAADYPFDAWQAHIQGRTTVVLSIDAAGSVVKCAIGESSGSKMLDDAACDALRKKARFQPAHTSTGRNVAGEYRRTISWAFGGSNAPAWQRQAPVIVTPDPLAQIQTPPTPLNAQEWITSADYPAVARVHHLEGVTTYRLIVDSSGAVADCDAWTDKDAAVLNWATCNLIAKRAHFRPAIDGKGQAVDGTYISSVSWTLPGTSRSGGPFQNTQPQP